MKFRDLGIPDKPLLNIARDIALKLVSSEAVNSVLAKYEEFLSRTSITYDSKDVSEEKKRIDQEDVMRHMFLGYSAHYDQRDYSPVDHVTAFDSGFAFFYTLDLALRSGKSLEEILKQDDFWALPKKEGKTEIIKIENEEREASNFDYASLPEKIVIYSVDRGAGKRSTMTYEQIAKATQERLTSIGLHGIVPGGVVGGMFHRTIFGSLNRADLCIMNYDRNNQGAILVPLDRFIQSEMQCGFKSSIAVMVREEKQHGTDIIVTSKEGLELPYIAPHDLTIVAPNTMNVEGSKVIAYDPGLWNGFHKFNEWLQTRGKDVLEYALGRKLSDMKSRREFK